MSRSSPNLLRAALLSLLALSAPVVGADGLTAQQAERVLQIKRLQQRLLMSEALEAAHERDEAVERVRQAIERRRATEEHPGARPGVRQRPAPVAPEEQIPPSKRGRSAGPLTANNILSYATNRPVSDPNLDDPNRADGQSEPSIAAWGNYVLAAWNDGRGNVLQPNPTLPSLMAYGYSTDGGQTFINPGSPPAQFLGGIWTSDPVVVVNEKTGDFYLCGLFDPPNASGDDENGVAVVRANFSGTTINWTEPVVVKKLLQTDGFIDKPWVAVDSMSGNVYVTYTRYTPTRDSIVFSRSRNKGLTWGPQITLSSNAAAGYVQGSRPAVGPDSVLYVTWKEIGTSASGIDYMRIRRSNDGGVTFGGEQTAAQFFDNFGTGAPGFNREQGITLPAIAIDRSTGPNRGRVYVAWNESVNFYDSIPDTVTTLNESEPVTSTTGSDDTPATAVPFTVGAVIRGSFNQQRSTTNEYSDFDYYSFSATQGATYLFWANLLPTRYTMRILGTDGQMRLAFSGDRFNSPPNQGFIVWTCPLTGTYYLRMAISGTTPGYYRVSTGFDIPGGPGQRARDQRDAFVASSPNGSTWSTPFMLSAPQPGWFDNWLPEVAVTGQGVVYALWYDFSDSPIASYGGLSQSYMARSDDGGINWAALGPVSDYFVNWTFTNSNIIPNQGDYMALFANSTTVIPCWTDGRVGTPDIWWAPFAIGSVQVAIESVVADTALVTLNWRAQGPYPASAAVLRADGGTVPYQYQQLGTVTFNASGAATFSDPTVLTAAQYHYALELTIGASTQIMGERTVVTPGRERPTFAFLGATPNPTKRGLRVRFSLPDNVRADLKLYDINGRPLRWRYYQGPGPYDEDFGAGLDLKPGVYFLRLTRDGTEIVRRVSIVP